MPTRKLAEGISLFYIGSVVSISTLLTSVFAALPQEVQDFFSPSQLEKENITLTEQEQNEITQWLKQTTLSDWALLESIFSIRKGAIDLSPSLHAPLSPPLHLLASLLCAAIRPDAELWQVTTLRLRGAVHLPEATIERLVRQCPNLQELDLSFCKQVTQCQFLLRKGEETTTLSALDLSALPLSEERLLAILRDHEMLSSLGLSHMEKTLTTSLLEKLMEENLSLRTLSLAANPHLQPLALVLYLRAHPLLEKIDLSSSPQFRSATLTHLLEEVPQLQHLSLQLESPPKPPLFYNFQILGKFLSSHLFLEELLLHHISFRINDLVFAFNEFPEMRGLTTKVWMDKEAIVFPKGVASELQKQKVEEIVEAFAEKNVLLLFP